MELVVGPGPAEGPRSFYTRANRVLQRQDPNAPLDLVQDRLSVIKLSALFYFAVGAIAVPVAYLPALRASVHVIPATLLIALAVAAARVIVLVPWRKCHPNWFLVVGSLASLRIGCFIWATGGTVSPFSPFVVLAAIAYYSDAWPVYILTLLVLADLVSHVLYAGSVDSVFCAELLARMAIVAFSFLVGRWLFQGLESAPLFSAKLQQEQRLVDGKWEFVSVVTHELRTPLTIVAGYREMLEMRTNLSEPVLLLMNKQRRGWERMTRLLVEKS